MTFTEEGWRLLNLQELVSKLPVWGFVDSRVEMDHLGTIRYY